MIPIKGEFCLCVPRDLLCSLGITLTATSFIDAEYEMILTDILLAYSGLKMETICLSETLISTYKATRRYNPEDTVLITIKVA
jgi:hypothetical protein